MVAAEVTRRTVARAGQELRLVTSAATGPGDFPDTLPLGERRSLCRLSSNLFIRLAFIQGQPLWPALMTINEFGVVQPHQPKNRRMNIMNVQPVFHRV